jgi:large subunit ribosomal protein L23
MNIIIKPIITEKMSGIADKMNRYGFVVHEDANKIQIKDAIKELYGVTVESVNTQRYIGKVKMRNTKNGFNIGLKGRCKKAIVTLKDGDTIDFYSNI